MRRKGYYFVSLLILCLLLSSVSLAQDQLYPSPRNQIRLGSFNIEKLGKDNAYQAKNAARILKNYDIVAIQEVMNTGASRKNPLGVKGVEALKRIVSYLGDDWAYIISLQPNGTLSAQRSKAFNTFEYYAFIYRKSKIELIPNSAHLWDESKNSLSDLKNQERQFDREPFIASFKVKDGNLDFTLITIHVAAPAARWRSDEIRRLRIVYEKVQDEYPEQNDIFLLGDFNTNVDKAEWEELKSIETMKHILTAANITTLNKSKGALSKNQYDTVWYQGRYSDEDVVVESAQVHEAWKEQLEHLDIKTPRKIKDPDSKLRWFYGRYASDHLPITLLLWVDKDTD